MIDGSHGLYDFSDKEVELNKSLWLIEYKIIIRHSEASEVPCVPVIEVAVVLVHSSPQWFSVD